jgi:transposase
MPRPYVRKHPHNRKKFDDLDPVLLRRLVREGYPKVKIARMMGVSRRHIYRLIETYC